MSHPAESSHPDPAATPALGDLLAAHLSMIKAYLHLRMGPVVAARETLDDLVQSVCADALAAADRFEYRGEAEFRAWLLRNALHKIIDKAQFYQRDRRDIGREVPPTGGDGPDPAVSAMIGVLATPSRILDARQQLERVQEALDELPEDTREAILMHRILGLRYAQIAERLGRSEQATRQLVSRGLSKLSGMLEHGT